MSRGALPPRRSSMLPPAISRGPRLRHLGRRGRRPASVQLVLEDDARGLAIDTRPEHIALGPRRRAAGAPARHAAEAALGLERGQALVAHVTGRPSRSPIAAAQSRGRPPSRPRCPAASTGSPTTSSTTPCSRQTRPIESRVTSSDGPRFRVARGRAIPMPASATARPMRFAPRSIPRMRAVMRYSRPQGARVGPSAEGGSISPMVPARSRPRLRASRVRSTWVRPTGRAPGGRRAPLRVGVHRLGERQRDALVQRRDARDPPGPERDRDVAVGSERCLRLCLGQAEDLPLEGSRVEHRPLPRGPRDREVDEAVGDDPSPTSTCIEPSTRS